MLVDSPEALSASLQDPPATLVEEQGEAEIVREGATGATGAPLDSVSRETPVTLGLGAQ